MIKRGEKIMVGPIRIEVINVKQDDEAVTRCEVFVAFGNVGLSAMSTWVDEPVLELLKQNVVDIKLLRDPTVSLDAGVYQSWQGNESIRDEFHGSYGGTDGDDD